MKPLKLTIEGLHSFTDKQIIDFNRLTETGLFGIFGVTGSGKSTILDAMTLALYGSVKRATSNTQGILNSQKDKLEVCFTFAIGNGNERKTYRAERSYRRNKDRLNSVIPKTSRFIEVRAEGEVVVADGQTEVNRMIQEIIGLNMTDFTRSVVLPQGEFAQFLKLRDAERDQMIERIFSLGEYGSKLTEKIKEERNQLSRQLEQVAGALKGIGDVSPAQIAEARSKLNVKQAEQQSVAWAYDKTEKAYEKAAEVWKLQEDLESALKEQEELHQKQPGFDYQKVLLQKAEAAQRIKPYDDACRKTEETSQESRNQFQKSCADLEVAQQAHQEIIAQKLRIDKECEERQPVLIELRTRLHGLLDDEAALNEKAAQKDLLITRREELRVRNADIRGRLQKGEDYKLGKEAERLAVETGLQELMVDSLTRENVLQGVGLTEEYQRALMEAEKQDKNLQEEQKHHEQLTGKIRVVEAERQRLLVSGEQVKQDLERHQAAKPGDLAGINGQNELLRHLEQQIDSHIRLEGELRTERNDAAQLTAALSEKEMLLGQLCRAIEDCRQKIGELETGIENLDCERKRIETENYAAVLAGGLAAGAPCPVCGSAHHPNPVQKHEATEMQFIQNELEAKRNQVALEREKLDSLNKELIKNETAQEVETLQLESLREKVRLKQNNLEVLKNGLPGELTTHDANQLQIYLAEKKKEFQCLFQAIETWDRETQTLIKKQEKITAEKNNLDTELGNLTGQLTAAENRFARLNQDYLAHTAVVTQQEHALTILQETLQIPDFHEKQTQILTQDRERDSLQEKIKIVTGQLEKAVARLLELKQETERLEAEERELTITEFALEREIGERKTKIVTAVGSCSVRDVLEETEGALTVLRQNVEQITNQFAASQERVNQLGSQNSADQRQADITAADFAAAVLEVQEKLRENGFINIMEYREAFRENHECEEIKQKIQEFEEKRQRAESRIQDIDRKLNGAKISAADWEDLKQTKNELALRKDLIAGEIGGLEMSLQTLEAQYRNMQQYLEERRAITQRKDMAEEIAKLLQGNAFVAYIAEEHMQYILADASSRLAVLTNGRYVLQMDEKKDFIICDYGNGGLSRPATSLSGGETFLVSLSLALALSSKIQLGGRNPLEFFFLDEGFGTLDPQLLETVMDSLERLQKESFTIGIISHVPELRERITRRLLVTPAGLNGEGSKVKVDIA